MIIHHIRQNYVFFPPEIFGEYSSSHFTEMDSNPSENENITYLRCRNRNHRGCITEHEVGQKIFKECVESVIKNAKLALRKSQETFINQGVPLESIVYVNVNTGSTYGCWFYEERDAISLIELTRGCTVIHEYKPDSTGQDIFCLDGQDTEKMKAMLKKTIEHYPESWKEHLAKINAIQRTAN